MIPKLYKSNYNQYAMLVDSNEAALVDSAARQLVVLQKEVPGGIIGNGAGALAECISCTVTEERNGAFELEMIYPVGGIHYDDIALREIIAAAPNPTANEQYFRIYQISRPIDGQVTINAEHISYDLSGIPVSPFSAGSAAGALTGLAANAATDCPFAFWTDKNTTANFATAVPASIRSLLGGSSGSILDVYGGEYEWDNYTIRLYNHRGEDRGVSIRYGKNLVDLTQEENCANVYTGVYPYWADADGNLVQLPEKIVQAGGNYDFVRILTLDFSQDWQEAPTVDQLRRRAEAYIKANNIGVPRVSLKISFVQLEQTEEYKNMALLERVSLCDTVEVSFARLGVQAQARVCKTTYNVLLDRYDSVELGDARTNIADTIVDQGKAVEEAPTRTFLEQAVGNATQQITGNLGGYVVLHSSSGGKEPDEILVMDQPEIANATKVWRWNKSGLGYSRNGYNGPFGLAMTQDGQIVADYVATGTLNASIIGAGVLQSLDKQTFFLDLEAGILRMKATELTIAGQTVEQISTTTATNVAGPIANAAAQNAVNAQTQTDIFNKLTNNGAMQGLYMQNGQLYINASYIQTGTLKCSLLDAGIINHENSYWNLGSGEFRSGSSGGTRIDITPGTINQYYNSNLTGVIHSLYGKTYMGCNSAYMFLGWFSSAAPSFDYSVGGGSSDFVGIAINHPDSTIHCNAAKFEIPGRIECSSLRVNGRDI